MFASLNEAVAEGKAKATTLANGELDALHLRTEDARVYVNCAQMAKAAGIPLDLLVKDAVEAVKVVDGKVSLLEMAKEFKRRKMHELPDKMLPVAVDKMIETRGSKTSANAKQSWTAPALWRFVWRTPILRWSLAMEVNANPIVCG